MFIKTAIIKKIKSKLSDIAKYLEEAGMCGAKELRKAMDAIDGSFADDVDYAMTSSIPHDQLALPGSTPHATDGSRSQQISLFDGQSGAESLPSFAELISKLIKIANKLDKSEHYEEADGIDEILKEFLSDKEFKIIEDLEEKEDNKKKKKVKPEEKDKEDEDVLVGANGHVGTGVTDNQNAGSFQGFSDAYFYSGYGNLEGVYGPANR